MALAKKRSDWQMVSSMEATYLNFNIDKKSKRINPDDLNPYIIKKKKNMITGKAAWDILKQAFVKKD